MAKFIVTGTIGFNGPAFKSKEIVEDEIQNMLDSYFYDNRSFLEENGESNVFVKIENIKRG